MARSVKQTGRLSETEQAQLQRAAKDRGYLNPTARIRAAIQGELAGREIEGISAEQRIAATLERLSRDIVRAHRGQQALFAVRDTQVKVFLTCVPEPPRNDAMNQVLLGRGIVITGLSSRLARRWQEIRRARCRIW